MTTIRQNSLGTYRDQLNRMRTFRTGDVLGRAAERLVADLPANGSVLLLGGSTEGLALAAAAAVLRKGAPTSWAPLELRMDSPDLVVDHLVVVEPIDGGVGWRDLVARRYPKAEIVIAKPELAVAA